MLKYTTLFIIIISCLIFVRYHNWNGGADAQVDVSARLANINKAYNREGLGGDGGGRDGPVWMRIGIKGFAQYTAFPLHLCVAVKPATAATSSNHNNNETTILTDQTNDDEASNNSSVREAPLVMHVHTFDQPLGQAQNLDLIKGLSRHLVYHRCALHIDHYEVVVQDEHLDQYLADPDLRSLAQQVRWTN